MLKSKSRLLWSCTQPQAPTSTFGPKNGFWEEIQMKKKRVGSREGVGAHGGGWDCSHCKLHQLKPLCNHTQNTSAYLWAAQIFSWMVTRTGNALPRVQHAQLGEGRDIHGFSLETISWGQILQRAIRSHNLSSSVVMSNQRVLTCSGEILSHCL